MFHLQFDRLDGVAKSKPGLVAQQEVDDAEGKDLASESQVEAAKSSRMRPEANSTMPRRIASTTRRCLTTPKSLPLLMVW